MTSVDELFKKSGIPSKRKLEPIRDPNEIYKSAKYSSGSNPTRHVRVEDDQDVDDNVEAGPALPPPDKEEDSDNKEAGPDLPPDDEEGRFFGGGISADQERVLDYVDSAEKQQEKNSRTSSDLLAGETKFDEHWLRRTVVAFERKINKNAELRAKFPHEPAKFIESEADLDQAVRDLAALAQWPELYGEFVRLGSAGSLVGLLAHENSDVAIAAVQTLGELTDEDVGAGEEEWKGLVGGLLEGDLLGLVGSNLKRLDEGDERDREGVYHAMSLLENLCSGAAEEVGAHEGVVGWLLERATKMEEEMEGVVVGQNKQYAAELIGILCSSGRENGERLARMDAVDRFLQLAALYRRHDPPKGGEEEEFVGNVFEALTAMVDAPLGKTKFVQAEGVELVLLILSNNGNKEKRRHRHKKDETSTSSHNMAKSLSLRLLAHAASASGGREEGRLVCEKIVQEGGLKPLFTTFMRRSDAQTLEQLLDVFASMLRLLPAGSAERIRLLAKFVEKGYEKIQRLVLLRQGYVARLAVAEEEIRREEQDRQEQKRKSTTAAEGDGEGEEEDDAEKALREFQALSKRLEFGLFALQLVDQILAWLVAEDDGAGREVRKLLAKRDEGLDVLGRTLREQMEGLDEEDEEAGELREVLGTLVTFVV